MEGGNWKLIISTVDWFLIGLYALIGLLLLLAKPSNVKNKFRTYTALFCLNLAVVYTLVLCIARQEVQVTGYFCIVLILAPSLLSFFWMLLVESVFDFGLKIKKYHLVFLLPFCSLCLFISYLFIFKGYDLIALSNLIQNFDSYLLPVIIGVNQIFFGWSFFLILKKYRQIKPQLETLFPESFSIRWLKSWGLVIMISALVFHTATFIDFKPDNLFFVPIIMFHFFIWILITFTVYPELFSEFNISVRANLEKSSQGNSVGMQKLESLAIKLDNEVITNKLYLNQKIDVQTVAASLELKVYELSMILSQVKTTNFNQYINQFRIEELIRKLNSGVSANITIEALGQEVGFKSRSSFYAAFKKHTGQTPTEYIDKLKN